VFLQFVRTVGLVVTDGMCEILRQIFYKIYFIFKKLTPSWNEFKNECQPCARDDVSSTW